ncbi:MAG TPA: DUF885 family protein, partial [Pyrinomonadaceae bacterium]|nr:DUF885 family protein [Pyrinomonadaceae bacterium]
MKYTFFLVLIALLAIACQPPASNNASNAPAAAKADWDGYVDHFLNDYFAANPTTAVYQGKHEYDGKFPDWSDEGIKKEIARLKSEREKAAAFRDEDLDERQRFERDYLIAQIDKELFWSETVDYPHINPNFYSDALDPDVYVSRPYAPLEQRIMSFTTYAKNVPTALTQLKTTLKTPMPKALV